jgi:hypothetical protein
MSSLYRCLALVLCLACARDGQEAANRAPTSVASDAGGGLAVGAPCTEKDGYRPKAYDCPAPDGGADGPRNCLPPDTPEYWERNRLPPGIGYCLTGPVYPYGYFTMNCASRSDCPAGSECDSTQCRVPCTSNADCRPPTTCPSLLPNPAPNAVPFCQCSDCLRRTEW